MADGFSELNPEQLQSPDGINQLNRMLRTIYDNIAGDTDGVRVFSGYGTPEGVVTAGIGSMYMRLDGGANTSVYIKESGTGNTGWVANVNLTVPISLANGGTGASLSDPGADRILFWDDSGGAIDWLTAGSGLTISGTTISANDGINTSNVLFQYQASTDIGNSALTGEIQATSLNAPSTTSSYRYLRHGGDLTKTTVLSTKWKKIAGVSTITVYLQGWMSDAGHNATITVNVGSATNNTGSFSDSTPVWKNFTIDVSGLSNDTVYDVTYQITVSNAGVRGYIGSLVAFGS